MTITFNIIAQILNCLGQLFRAGLTLQNLVPFWLLLRK